MPTGGVRELTLLARMAFTVGCAIIDWTIQSDDSLADRVESAGERLLSLSHLFWNHSCIMVVSATRVCRIELFATERAVPGSGYLNGPNS